MKETIGKVYVARDSKIKVGFKVISQVELKGRLVIKVLWFDKFGWADKDRKPTELGVDQFVQEGQFFIDINMFDGEFNHFREVIPEMTPVWMFEIEDVFDPFANVDIKEEDEFDPSTMALASHLFNAMIVCAVLLSIFLVIKSVW